MSEYTHDQAMWLALVAGFTDRTDFEIMQARTLASGRGASPAEIQANVMALDSDAFPIRVTRGPW